MKWEVTLITAILALNAITFGQLNSEDMIKVNITLTNNSINLETAFTNLGVNLNRSAVYMLVLNNVYARPGKPIFNDNHFKEFSALTSLHLENGKIDVFPDGTFVNWNNSGFKCSHKTLDLVNIGLKSISKNLLKPILVLDSLNLSHNDLTHLSNDVFENSPKLNCVDLSYNKLNNFSQHILQPIKRLRQLFLNNNNITSLSEDMFSSQKASLRNLDLSFNDIQSVHGKVFAGMDYLTTLTISHAFSPKYNSTHLPPKIFENTSNLWVLQADQNNFEDLPEDIFSDLRYLEKLNLSSNNIKYLSPKIFENNHHLRSLSLDYNKLRYLNDSLFQNLIELSYLNLANNQLTFSYKTEIFSSLFQLRTIILDNNKEVQLAYNGSKSILYNCSNTQSISAHYTNISEIYADWHSLQNLGPLDLTNTSVGKIQTNFSFLSKNVQLMLTGSSDEFLILSKNDMIAPNKEAGQKYILDKNQNCGLNCSCVFNILYYENIIRLYCSRFDRKELLSEIPNIIIIYSHLSFKIEFILDNCRTLDFQHLVYYLRQISPGKVTKLALSNTGLSSISDLDTDHLSHLEVLELANNNFTSLEPRVIEQLRNSQALKRIKLHKNNWTCSCGSKEFIQFVKNNGNNNKIEIPNIEEVLCSDGQRVDSYDVDRACDTTRSEIVLFTLTFIAILITGSIGTIAVYRRYAFYINSYAYQYRDYLPEWVFPDEENIDRDKIYDAFVSFAKDDETFIKTRLKPMLEDQEPHFKLCIHIRDWDIGRLIDDQIYRSIPNSRRTIVVLSHNFLNSQWCKLEFQVALNQAIQDRVNRLVVIMLEDIATHRLNEDLRGYITKYTYIPWQDTDWFWDKLRYALPHRRKTNTETNRNENSNEEHTQMIQLQQNSGRLLHSSTE